MNAYKNAWSKEFLVCHYWFFNQDPGCNGCHGLTNLCLNISDIAIITVKNIDYLCIIQNVKKSEAIIY